MVYVTQARVSAAEAERALRANVVNENMQHTLASLIFEQGGLAAVLVDRDGRVVAMSKSMRDGLSIKDELGAKLEDVIQWSSANWRDAFKRAMAGEHVRYDEDNAATERGHRWFTWEARPWRNASGEICGVIAHGRGITQLVEARQEAAANEQRLKIALEAGRSVVWEIDFKSKTLSWHGDPAPVYGVPFSYQQFIDNTTPILHVEDRPALKDYFEAVIAGADYSIEHRVIRGGGDIGWAAIWARRVSNSKGGLRKLVVLSKDVTTRKRQEADFIAAMRRTEEALKAKRALFGNIDALGRTDDRIDEAAVRVFSNAAGNYGTNVNFMVLESQWEDGRELGDLFVARKCFAYGRDSQGRSFDGSEARKLLERALSRVEVTYQNIDTTEVGITDVDHYFEYLGGVSKAVEKQTGKRPRIYLSDTLSPNAKVRTLEETVRLETRTKTLNPKWFEGMLRHGFSGVAEIEHHVTNTFGWSATADAVDDWVYDEVAATFVLDAQMLERLRSLNPHSARTLVGRLLEASGRGFWSAEQSVLERLRDVFAALEDKLEGVAG
jgi:PAS domain S-box-containing protein